MESRPVGHVDRVANGILIIACTANAGAAASIEALLEREPEPMSRHVPVADVITITPGALYAIRSLKCSGLSTCEADKPSAGRSEFTPCLAV